jgi:hypothetical protein
MEARSKNANAAEHNMVKKSKFDNLLATTLKFEVEDLAPGDHNRQQLPKQLGHVRCMAAGGPYGIAACSRVLDIW